MAASRRREMSNVRPAFTSAGLTTSVITSGATAPERDHPASAPTADRVESRSNSPIEPTRSFVFNPDFVIIYVRWMVLSTATRGPILVSQTEPPRACGPARRKVPSVISAERARIRQTKPPRLRPQPPYIKTLTLDLPGRRLPRAKPVSQAALHPGIAPRTASSDRAPGASPSFGSRPVRGVTIPTETARSAGVGPVCRRRSEWNRADERGR